MRIIKQTFITLLVTSLIICSCPEPLSFSLPGSIYALRVDAKDEMSQENIGEKDVSDAEDAVENKISEVQGDITASQDEADNNEEETEVDRSLENAETEDTSKEAAQVVNSEELNSNELDETELDNASLSDTTGDEIEDKEGVDEKTSPNYIDNNDEELVVEPDASVDGDSNREDCIDANPETEKVSTPSVNAGEFSETIELNAGSRVHRMYQYDSPNIIFENPYEEYVGVSILSCQSSGGGYLYSVGYTGLLPGTNSPIRPYNPDTGEYLDLIIVHVSAYELTDTACVGSTYGNRLTGAKEELPVVTVEGPSTPKVNIIWNGSSTGLGGTTHYYAISTVFDQVGTYTLSLLDAEKWKLIGTLTVVVGDHFWDDGTIEKAATCLEEGLVLKTCTLCGNTLEETIPVSEHVWDTKFTVDREATCISEGKKSIHCTVCDGINANTMVSIPKAEHQWKDNYTVDIWPTCTEDGLASTYCAVCGTQKPGSEFVLPSLGHQFGEWHELYGPTCTEYGIKQRYCSSCGDIEEEAIPETGHIWEDYYQIHDPTCTTDGYEGIYCSVCGALNEETFHIIQHTGHSYGDWSIIKESSCTEEGNRRKVCRVCGNTVTETLPLEPHSWNDFNTVDKEATCLEEGSMSIHCAVCDVIDGETVQAIPKKEHNYGKWETIKEAKCTEEGSKEKICVDCGDKATEIIPAAGHSWNEEYIVDKEATYNDEGSESIHCSICNEIRKGSTRVIPKLQKPLQLLDVSGIATKTYTGKPLTQEIVVKDGTKILHNGTDYTISYKNNISAGKATLTISGAGDYTGIITKEFEIQKAVQNITVKASVGTIDVGKTTRVTASGAKETNKYTFTSSNPKVATVNATGTVTGKAAGTVTITVKTAATTNYNAASKTVKITVNKVLKKPGNCHFVKWNNSKYTSCRIAWNKVAGADGYQTLLSWTDGTHASTTYTKSNVLYRNCSVHPQHVSQMKVRAFYMSGGQRKFGPWSNVEYITPSPTKLTTKNTSAGANLKMNLTWNIIYGCNGYNVFITTNPNGTWYWNQSTSQKATSTNAVVTEYRGAKLKKNTRYYVRIVTRRKRNGVFCTVPMPATNTNIGSFIIN